MFFFLREGERGGVRERKERKEKEELNAKKKRNCQASQASSLRSSRETTNGRPPPSSRSISTDTAPALQRTAACSSVQAGQKESREGAAAAARERELRASTTALFAPLGFEEREKTQREIHPSLFPPLVVESNADATAVLRS